MVLIVETLQQSYGILRKIVRTDSYITCCEYRDYWSRKIFKTEKKRSRAVLIPRQRSGGLQVCFLIVVNVATGLFFS